MATIIELNAGFEFKNNKANKTYTIEKLIGSGGFADVFLVHHTIEKLIGNGGFADAFLVHENKTKQKYSY